MPMVEGWRGRKCPQRAEGEEWVRKGELAYAGCASFGREDLEAARGAVRGAVEYDIAMQGAGWRPSRLEPAGDMRQSLPVITI